jgi:spermidine/putrescine transport system substrate-binding protein
MRAGRSHADSGSIGTGSDKFWDGAPSMEKNEFMDRLAEGRLTRRDFAKTLAAMGLGLAATMRFGRPARAAEAGALQVFTWAGYDIPELHGDYVQKYGGSPSFTLFGGTEEAFQKLQSGFVADVSHPCVEDIARWHKLGMIKKIDTARLKYWNDIWPELLDLPGARIDGEHWIVPFDWGNGSLLYRTDLIELEEPSWKLAFDERYAGKVSMYNATPTVTVAALVLGIDPFSFSDEEGARIKELLMKQRKLVRFYWDSPAEYQQAMASGEIAIAYAWNDGLAALRKQGVPVEYMVPKEGILSWTCGLVHMANATAPDEQIYDFIDAMCAPETGKYMIEQYGYGHCNRKSFEVADAKIVADLGFSSPAALFESSVFETETTPEMELKRNQIFEEVRAGG